MGDRGLAEAVHHNSWSRLFCHVVSRHDFVPRILLAPVNKIRQPLKAMLPFWLQSMQQKKKAEPRVGTHWWSKYSNDPPVTPGMQQSRIV